eukprot:TRINITY_DN8847_c0_g2_i2.p2 TRINITY_DN8847_c0_g2~~TRINITY_DN8847_c0_g2_i2.p2  ORF type:complete len:209 (-),score=-9.57 TRINITY_DN8847_c0_g2_i2:372-998(-)
MGQEILPILSCLSLRICCETAQGNICNNILQRIVTHFGFVTVLYILCYYLILSFTFFWQEYFSTKYVCQQSFEFCMFYQGYKAQYTCQFVSLLQDYVYLLLLIRLSIIQPVNDKTYICLMLYCEQHTQLCQKRASSLLGVGVGYFLSGRYVVNHLLSRNQKKQKSPVYQQDRKIFYKLFKFTLLRYSHSRKIINVVDFIMLDIDSYTQ